MNILLLLALFLTSMIATRSPRCFVSLKAARQTERRKISQRHIYKCTPEEKICQECFNAYVTSVDRTFNRYERPIKHRCVSEVYTCFMISRIFKTCETLLQRSFYVIYKSVYKHNILYKVTNKRAHTCKCLHSYRLLLKL